MALVFPSNLQGDGDQFLSMFIHKNYRMKRDTIAQKPRLLEIVLPIPNNLVQSTAVSYQQESLGFIGKQAAELSEAFNGGVKSIASTLKQQLTSQNVGEGLKYFGAQIAQDLGSQIPGIGDIIGPSGNYATLDDPEKFVLIIAMILGRLELLVVMALFMPMLWRD